MATNNKTKKPLKPTVFLSHSSSNRREVLGLKRFLDERSGGLIDFFLSSDDDSIAHGTIWPEEVRNALDRMTLMLIFVSTEALKSGWTYFEAGYGLHKLGSAKIYCLPGTDKGSLPSPFNILQNRNLHSTREIGLLIKQCNDALGASMKEGVSQEDFDRIFKKPLMVQLETTPSFERLVKNISLSVIGPANSAEILSKVCLKKNFTVSPVSEEGLPQTALTVLNQDMFVTSGLRLGVKRPYLEELKMEIRISAGAKKDGKMYVTKLGDDDWHRDSGFYNEEEVSIAEVEAYNSKIRIKNLETNQINEEKSAKPRRCEFELAPTNVSVPIGIIDDWLIAAKISEPIEVRIYLGDEVQRESRIETITAKIHGSELSLNADGSYLWGDKTIININWLGNRSCDLNLKPLNGNKVLLSEFRIQELVASLFQLTIIRLQPHRSGARRK